MFVVVDVKLYQTYIHTVKCTTDHSSLNATQHTCTASKRDRQVFMYKYKYKCGVARLIISCHFYMAYMRAVYFIHILHIY